MEYEITKPPQCMPNYCKNENDIVAAYRKYYIEEKQHIASWTRRPVPDWFKRKDWLCIMNENILELDIDYRNNTIVTKLKDKNEVKDLSVKYLNKILDIRIICVVNKFTNMLEKESVSNELVKEISSILAYEL